MSYGIYMQTGRTDTYANREGYVAKGQKNPNNVRRGSRQDAIRFASMAEAEAFIDRFAQKGAWKKGTSFIPGQITVYAVAI